MAPISAGRKFRDAIESEKAEGRPLQIVGTINAYCPSCGIGRD